jgi:hypothetical protein
VTCRSASRRPQASSRRSPALPGTPGGRSDSRLLSCAGTQEGKDYPSRPGVALGAARDAGPGTGEPPGAAANAPNNLICTPTPHPSDKQKLTPERRPWAYLTHAQDRSRRASPMPHGSDTAGGPPVPPDSRTDLLAVANGNRYADLTSAACRASAGCGREQTMTAMRTTGHHTTVETQPLDFRRACRT